MSVADQMQRFGLLLPQGRPAVVLAGAPLEIARLYPAIDAALKQRPAYRLVLTGATRDLAELRRRYPHEVVLPLPHLASRRHWRRLNASLVIGPAVLAVAAEGVRFIDSSQHITLETLATMLPPLDAPKQKSATGTFLIDLFGGRRITSLASLRARLGDPGTIVCLGNGPSSEEPGLAEFSAATLFRVNWNWRGRGWLTAPDVVFTADPDLPGFGRRPVIAFPTAFVGRPILLRHTRAMRPPSTGYVFLDALEPPLTDLSGPMIPTNGALMIAVAAALKPERIVISGMDLYRHPQGRYPGDTAAQDGYSREHSAEIDLNLIRTALGAFAGKTTILSDNLRSALRGAN